VQGTGEGGTFSRPEFDRLMDLGALGIDRLRALQRESLGAAWPFGR